MINKEINVDIVSLLCKLDKESLVVLCVGGFKKENVNKVVKCDGTLVKLYMKDGSMFNVNKYP